MSEIFRSGLKVDAAAKNYQAAHPGTSYSVAMRQVIKQANETFEKQTAQAARRYHEEHGTGPRGWKIFEDSAGNVVDLQLGDGESISKLSHVVSGLPRLGDGSIDIALALRLINAEFTELSMQSAGAFLGHIVQKIMGESHPADAMTPTDAMRKAQQEYPSVAAVYNGSRMSEAALKQILLPLFKTEQTPPGPGERSYGAKQNYERIARYDYTPSTK